MAFIKRVNPNTKDSHQTSPGYVLTCLRWDNRDTFNYEGDPLDIRKPLVIINDAIQVTVNNSKAGQNSSMVVVLKGGDINYATALNPGDYILVNMLNWEKDVWDVAVRAAAGDQINKQGDGFKGMYKIQTVNKNISVDANGIKSLSFTINAHGFTEMSNIMMFNPAIVSSFEEEGALLHSTAIGAYYQDKMKEKVDCQTIVRDLFKILIGKSEKSNDVKIPNYGNTHFKVPAKLGSLLGRKDAAYATDIFDYILGIWDAESSSSKDLGKGMNPHVTNIAAEGPNHFETQTPIQGNKMILMETWNNSKVWSIIYNNINSAMNEMYTTYRINKDGAVMPTVIVRQKPFTSNHFKVPTGFPVTKFFDLPRWDISPTLLLSASLGKNDAARFNFVQTFTRSLAATAAQDQAAQISEKNFTFDEGDISRNGLKPYIQTSNFDFPTDKETGGGAKKIRAKEWNETISDWILEGHLKMSGTLKFVGIQDPISVGDNLEFDHTIFHIESVNHTITMLGDKKTFRTTISVSYGVDKASDDTRPVYAEMEYTDAHTRNLDDYDNERILPGISDTQLSLGRKQTDGEEKENTKEESFTKGARPKKQESESAGDNTGHTLNPESKGFNT